MNKDLILIGQVQGKPVAIDAQTGELLVHQAVPEKEPMGSIFSDIGDVFKDHVGGLDLNIGGGENNLFDSGVWNSISGVFDSDTAVGQFVVPGIQTYVQNLATGGNYSPSPTVNYGGGYQTGGGFTPSQPQVITVPGNNVQAGGANMSMDLLSNPLVLGGVGLTVVVLILVIALK